MKICFISAYPPNKANLAEYAEYLIGGLKRRKEIEEIIILANKSQGYKNYEKKGKLKIVRCWRTSSLLIPLHLIGRILAFRKEIGIVHFNLNMMNWGNGKLVNFLGYSTPFLIKLFFRKKVIVTLHNIVDVIDLKKLKFISPSWINRLGLRIATKLLLSVDKVTVTISSYRRILERLYGAKNVVHIPHGFLIPIKKISLTKNRLLAFGFWDPRKRLDLLLKTFKELKKKNNSIKLIIAGTSHPKFPNYLEKIKEKINDPDIEFTGYVPQNKVKKLFLNSTLVVLPYTVSVGSSGVLHLAASYGRPVVMTKIKDLVKSVKEENLVVKLTSLKELRKAIEKVLYNEKLQKKMIKHNLRAAQKLSFDVIAKKFTSLYKELTLR
jgi:glycosyltransferase involved in cell wall biosynthesis